MRCARQSHNTGDYVLSGIAARRDVGGGLHDFMRWNRKMLKHLQLRWLDRCFDAHRRPNDQNCFPCRVGWIRVLAVCAMFASPVSNSGTTGLPDMPSGDWPRRNTRTTFGGSLITAAVRFVTFLSMAFLARRIPKYVCGPSGMGGRRGRRRNGGTIPWIIAYPSYRDDDRWGEGGGKLPAGGDDGGAVT